MTFQRPGPRGRCEVLDLLRLTLEWQRTRGGQSLVRAKTSGRRLRGKLRSRHERAKQSRSRCARAQLWKPPRAKLRGHARDSAVVNPCREVNTPVLIPLPCMGTMRCRWGEPG